MSGIAAHSQAIKPNPLDLAKLEKASEINQAILSFRDTKVSAYAQAQVADISWKLDQAFARTLFRHALNLLEPDKRDKKNDAYAKTAQRRKVIALIGRHDAKWAKTLLATPKEKSESDFPEGFAETQTAIDLLSSDERAAIEIASESINNAITPSLVDFLKQLRVTNPDQANALFLTTLTRFSSQSNGRAELLATLGTYLFASRNIPVEDTRSFSIVRIGNTMMPDISVNRPGTTAGLVTPFIRAAITLIYRPSTNAQERAQRYALGYLCVPKAQEFAPNLSAELMAAMASVSANVDPLYTTAAAYKYVGMTPGPPEERIKEIEKNPDAAMRDLLYLDMAFHAWRRKDLETARTATDKIEDKELREPLEILIDFGETSALLDDQEVDLFDVDKRITRMKDGPEKVLLWLRFASIAAKQRQVRMELDGLDYARQIAGRLAGNADPYFLTYIAARQKERGDPQANLIFFEAAKMFNREEAVGDLSLVRTLGRNAVTLRAQLEVKDIKIDFQTSVRKLYINDEENGILAISDLKDEKLKSIAYISLLRSYFERKEIKQPIPEPKNPTPVERRSVPSFVGDDGMIRELQDRMTDPFPNAIGSINTQPTGSV